MDAVKEPLKLPFVFLFNVICVTVVLSALSLFTSWGLTESAALPFTFTYLLQRLPDEAFHVLIPSVVVSMVIVGFRMARRPFSRLAGFLIVAATGYIVLVNGMILLSTLAGKARPTMGQAANYLQPRTFLRLGGVVLAPTSVSGANLGGVLVYEADLPAGKLSVAPGGTAFVQGDRLTVNLAGQRPEQISGTPMAARASVFAPDALTSLFLRDIATLTDDFRRLMTDNLGEFFAACFALVFLCAASLVLLRLTKWPLANIMLLLIVVRGYFVLYHLLATRYAPEVAGAVTDPMVARMFPVAAFIVLGVILLLVDILFIPADRWVRKTPA